MPYLPRNQHSSICRLKNARAWQDRFNRLHLEDKSAFDSATKNILFLTCLFCHGSKVRKICQHLPQEIKDFCSYCLRQTTVASPGGVFPRVALVFNRNHPTRPDCFIFFIKTKQYSALEDFQTEFHVREVADTTMQFSKRFVQLKTTLHCKFSEFAFGNSKKEPPT